MGVSCGMYRYWSVGQAILNREWQEKYGQDWNNIRIEVTKKGDAYPCEEMSVFFRNDRGSFPDWVDDLEPTETILTIEELLRMYRQGHGMYIEILRPGGYDD